MDKKNKVVLIIEDDLPLQNAYKTLLNKSGYEVIFAATGKNGFHKAKTEKPELIILDLMLPGGMSGFVVLEKLKKSARLFKNSSLCSNQSR